MTSTTHTEWDANTEGLEVAKAFSDGIRGKTIIVTGVNIGGIGYTTAQAFASQSPAHIIIAGRTQSKLQECIDALTAEFPGVDYRVLLVDLSSQKSVRDAAAEVLSWSDVPTVDFIINSGGVMGVHTRTLSPDGIELHFATNHIGHWLLTCLIMPKLIKAAAGKPKGATRVINVTSLSPVYSSIRWSDINFDKTNKDLPKVEQPSNEMLSHWRYKDIENQSYIPLEGYNQSKVANVLSSIAANKRLYERHGILSLALHPGIIHTELARNFQGDQVDFLSEADEKGYLGYKSLSAGSSTSLVAALDPKLGPSETRNGLENYGVYLSDCQIFEKGNPLAVSSTEAEKLWKLSEELVKQEFAW